MKTVLEYDDSNMVFLPKKSLLALYRKKDKQMIGEADFDLSQYANKAKPTSDKLYINSPNHEGAYIEIYIKTKASDSA